MTAFPNPDGSKACSSQERRFQLMFVVCSGLTVLAGTVAIIATGAGPSLWLRNPVMWCVTVALCARLRRWRMPPPWLLVVMIAALALSILVGPHQSGVHRWLAVGPVLLNIAALIMPAAIVLMDRGCRMHGRPGYALAALAMAAMLAWQPDMSQLTGLIAAAVMWALAQRRWRSLVWIAPVALLALLICASRPDPLAAVPHVEGIFQLAADVSPLLALGGGLCLLLTSLSPLAVANDVNQRPAAVALSAYFLVSGFAWLYGAFPVPLAGYGISFILGWLIGATTLLIQQAKGNYRGLTGPD
ncbi:hypothetical protein FHW58_002349 [Duganella sp. 1224]|uniref:hypothetical protein n=1 Tax=Duganella sp. 1224 TaxID=2587052 RepID=UPI0015C98D4E|nr:hypothetical protein [Duganella sp. 1224]NYE61197.1 hypothetical protein [Duganella sp. 1224]